MPKVPDAILNNIRCLRCKNWLSCGPVILLPNGGSICGRCQIHKEGPRDQYRHFAFEALACYFKFPCKHWERNCPENLTFKKVLNHEDNCSYGSTCGTLFSHPSAAFKSKRQLDIRAAIKLEIIPDQVLEYLRCGNCAGYLSCTPIFVCRDGTSICHRCSTQLQQPAPEFIRDPAFEIFVDMMIFPCIFRYRGCTQFFKFGEQSREHEVECPYGKPYSRDQHRGRQQEQGVRRQESIQGGHKERGVIETHSGHIYATITPNAPVFARPTNKQEKEMFLDEFQRHRENLSNRWGRPGDNQPQVFQYPEPESPRYSNGRYPARGNNSFAPADAAPRSSHQGRHNNSFVPADGSQRPSLQNRPDSLMYENTGYGNGLIDELRYKQHLKKTTPTGSHPNGDYDGRRTSQMDDNEYYGKEREPRKMEYTVYS